MKGINPHDEIKGSNPSSGALIYFVSIFYVFYKTQRILKMIRSPLDAVNV